MLIYLLFILYCVCVDVSVCVRAIAWRGTVTPDDNDKDLFI